MLHAKEKAIRYTIGSLLLIVALNAFGGGWYGMAGAKDVPTEWLEGSPFNNYFIPALVLFTGVGGSAITAAILNFINHRLSNRVAFLAGSIMLVWIAVQVVLIGYVSWLQPAVAIAGVAILILSAYRRRLHQRRN